MGSLISPFKGPYKTKVVKSGNNFTRVDLE